MANAFLCNQCGRAVEESRAVGWLGVRREGIDVSTYDERTEWTFCGEICLLLHFANKASKLVVVLDDLRAPGPAPKGAGQ